MLLLLLRRTRYRLGEIRNHASILLNYISVRVCLGRIALIRRHRCRRRANRIAGSLLRHLYHLRSLPVGGGRLRRRNLQHVRGWRIRIRIVGIVVRRRHRHSVIRPPERIIQTAYNYTAEEKAEGCSIRGIASVIVSIVVSVVSAGIVMAAVVMSSHPASMGRSRVSAAVPTVVTAVITAGGSDPGSSPGIRPGSTAGIRPGTADRCVLTITCGGRSPA